MTLKLLFDPETGRVLVAQAVGGAGVDKRIDVLAMANQAGMTVYDLEEAELAYSPQYGSAKDPINMAGFVAAGLLRGDHPQLDIESALDGPQGRRPYLLGVRTPEEFAESHIPGAVNIPVDELRQRLGEAPRGREVAAYCQVGQRGYLATRILLQSGFRAANFGAVTRRIASIAPSCPVLRSAEVPARTAYADQIPSGHIGTSGSREPSEPAGRPASRRGRRRPRTSPSGPPERAKVRKGRRS
jgi:rhodanese-related sulfurtransferase